MDVDQFKKLQKHFEQELMEDYRFDDRALYLVKDDEKYDIVPEILNGKNIADYIDQDIFEKLENLEEKEGLREAAGFYDSEGVYIGTSSCLSIVQQVFVTVAYKSCLFRKSLTQKTKRYAKQLTSTFFSPFIILHENLDNI